MIGRFNVILLIAVIVSPCFGQWVTQRVDLQKGWNGVFLHVDPSHSDLDAWIGVDAENPIVRIWRWNPPTAAQFYENPADEIYNVSGWSQWNRLENESGLSSMVGDTAYLVESLTNYTWNVKGRPVSPRSSWNMNGLNLIGFPTTRSNPPKFDEFLSESSELQTESVDIYRYQGTSLSTNNPIKISSSLHRNVSVTRGQAFWMEAGNVFNKYFGPFEVSLSGSDGIYFYDDLSSASLRLRNLTEHELTITMRMAESEPAPVGQPLISGTPPLLIRDLLNVENMTYGFTELPIGRSQSWTLAPCNEEGSEVNVVLGLDRTSITQNEGDLLAGVLQLTDSLGHLEVNVPVSGTVASDKGLWVGEALVSQVGQYLKSYEDGSTNPIITTNGSMIVTNDLLMNARGEYQVSEINTDITDVPKWFPLRLIIHSPEDGDPVLLQRVFSGMDFSTNQVLSCQQAALNPAYFDSARRISATHLPWTEKNSGWSFDGALTQGTLITTTVNTAYNDQQSNPFLHTYHPDHDNLDDRFEKELEQGAESYTIERTIRLLPEAAGTNFTDRISSSKRLIGNYQETIKLIGLPQAGGADHRTFEVRGAFRLDRISDIPKMTEPLN